MGFAEQFRGPPRNPRLVRRQARKIRSCTRRIGPLALPSPFATPPLNLKESNRGGNPLSPPAAAPSTRVQAPPQTRAPPAETRQMAASETQTHAVVGRITGKSVTELRFRIPVDEQVHLGE